MARQVAKKLVPLLDRVLIEKLQAPGTTIGGVLIPENLQNKLNEGKVVAVGPGALTKDGQRIPTSVKVGDTVLLPEYGGMTVKLGDKELHLFRDEDIMGIIE
mmetsp:Transcript_44824/g.72995  ORF Transcript_44824/g.72995 Transcript_44824/m.72995 type:complete len:102 (-) Transcript_44824:70-375(-)|eukprot:CAMPEP_0184643282 /NCGR_PEP_ID=MMETSP0308-20130426/84_1 /TAXON_ID=38269 /ORGANISM="Gloeochaete witrockiana, Strain SAG 46.84" /LENGTH=101 /DNA_ID=CAMNT_0027071085 /DNA_START=79 /DNA_END=384 /DNA_ORIENTATION=+